MMKQVFNEQDLPMEDLLQLGLVKNGKLLLDEDDLTALLSGRRTGMLRLVNLEMDGVSIRELDAKLSLNLNKDGSIGMLLHPIYREPEVPQFLDDIQAEMLEKGDVPNLPFTITGDDGKPKEVLVSFDKDTNEFIVTDTGRIQAPDEVNSMPLTEEQKKKYRAGQQVETADGTTIQYSATDKQGIRSDKLALIASILVDGGVSYLLYRGLHKLFGKEQDKAPGKNYDQALKNMEAQEARRKGTVLEPGEDFDEEESHSMSY
jgi:hypothetical protein